MMYFFVFSPPKITGAVRPAFSAMSVKCAIGFALPAPPARDPIFVCAGATSAIAAKTPHQSVRRVPARLAAQTLAAKFRFRIGLQDGTDRSARGQCAACRPLFSCVKLLLAPALAPPGAQRATIFRPFAGMPHAMSTRFPLLSRAVLLLIP